MTTPFEQTLSGKEVIDKNNAIGWVKEYRTHSLTLLPAGNVPATDQCQNDATSFCPFQASGQADATTRGAETTRRGLLLSWEPGRPDLPAYMPLWSVAVDPAIMKDHGDFWNPQIVRLITVLFTDAYEQTECMHGRFNAVTPAADVGGQHSPDVAIFTAFGDACRTQKTSNGKAS